MATTLDQLHYRFRNDDGVEAGASWVAAEDTKADLFAGRVYRVRFSIQESGGTAWTAGSAVLRYSTDDSTYTAAGANTPIVAAGSKYYSNGADTTVQLTAGTGSYTSDNNGMTSDALTCTFTVGASGHAELEYCFKLVRTGDLKNGDTIYLKVYNNTSALDSYTVTAQINLVIGGGRGRRR